MSVTFLFLKYFDTVTLYFISIGKLIFSRSLLHRPMLGKNFK